MQVSRIERSFRSLSVADVVAARDAYHVHLLNQPNVVATAVGKYLVRTNDDAERPKTFEETLEVPPGTKPARTLANSRVERWSWPCVLVFVDEWMTDEDIAKRPDDMVPRRLYQPDGKVVPTCVVCAPPAAEADSATQHLSFPSALVGGGYVCTSDVQGRQRVGSIACLVSDGQLTYALTNRHVAGEPGRELYTMIGGTYVRIGTAAERSVDRLPFKDVYPGFAGERMDVAVDAGLIEIADVNGWTTQVFGVGALADLVDVSPESLTFDLVGTPVRAFGAASGALQGQILALYYRYRTRSGIEYVSDVVIGPRGADALQTKPGDSGTLWVLDPGDAPAGGRPPKVTAIAMEWGGDRLTRGGRHAPSAYALATFMSNVCRALDVEVVYDWNAHNDLYWGQVGHYTIGAKACELVDDEALRAFFLANRDSISFELADIAAGKYHTPHGTPFYPLADVPDLVWKMLKGSVRGHERPNHFADMDDPGPDGKSLLDLSEDPSTITPERWLEFYEALHTTPSNMGLLPFRVAQLYGVVVDSLRAGDEGAVARALCAAGTMAHYVGDACQPLHVSRYHDGRNADEKGVHEAYETTMVGAKRGEIIDGLAAKLANATPLEHVHGEQAVAQAVVALMRETFARLAPDRICDAFRDTHGDSEGMWAAVGEATVECIAAGCRTLAMLWGSAWAEAGALAPAATEVSRDDLVSLYSDPSFAPSMYLTELVAPAPAPAAAPAAVAAGTPSG